MTDAAPTGDDGAGAGRDGAPEPVPVSPPLPAWPSVAYWVRTTLAVVATLLLVAAARRVTHILLLVVMAFVLAVGVDPMVQWLGRLGVRRGWAVTIIFVGLASFLALFAVLLVPPLVQEVRQFADALPGYVSELQRRQDWIGSLARRVDATKIEEFVADIPSHVGSSLGTIIGVAGTVLGRVFDLFTIGILSIYFMLALPRLPRTVASLTRPAHRAQVDAVLRRSIEKIGGYVSGNLITSAVCGVLTALALVALRVPYAVPLGLWAGVADLIPQVGSYLGAIPAILVALTEGPGHGLAAAAFFIAYQQFENYILAPRVYQNSIDLSPAAVIVSTLVGGTLAGFAGALLALPVAATVKVLMTDVVLADRLRQRAEEPASPPEAARAGRRRRRRPGGPDTDPEPAPAPD
jgi:predicted PurR-regulated permease PerM